VPGPIYPINNPTLQREPKHFVTKIKNNGDRFISKEETERIKISPSPSTYLAAEAKDFSKSPRTNQKIGNSKRNSFVDVEAKLQISPGPVKNSFKINTLSVLTRGLGDFGASSRKRL